MNEEIVSTVVDGEEFSSNVNCGYSVFHLRRAAVLGKIIASLLDDLVPNSECMTRPHLDIVSTEMRVPKIKYFLEANGEDPSSMHERISTAIVVNLKSRGIFFDRCQR